MISNNDIRCNDTLPENPTLDDLAGIRHNYEVLVTRALEAVIDRCESSDDYPWVDTKMDTLVGQNYPDTDILRGKSTVYGWIQGRALESVAAHADWLSRRGNGRYKHLVNRCNGVIRRLFDKINQTRQLNGGHCYFFMDVDGNACSFKRGTVRVPVQLTPESPFNFSDLFCAKGMYAAACYLNDADAVAQARQYCKQVFDALWTGRFVSDQHFFNTDNCPATSPLENKRSHGPYMIAIGMANLFAENEDEKDAVASGLKLIDYITTNHVNTGQWSTLNLYDFVEFLDSFNKPFSSSSGIHSDPGHALEFVGLSLKFLHIAANRSGQNRAVSVKIRRFQDMLPHVLFRNFDNGYQPEFEGICKIWDLVQSAAVEPNMPWWSLPETMRAAIYCVATTPNPTVARKALRIYSLCHNAFIRHYMKPELNYFCIQARGADGLPASVIPATPDADPCYHTGLSLLDCIQTINRLTDAPTASDAFSAAR